MASGVVSRVIVDVGTFRSVLEVTVYYGVAAANFMPFNHCNA